MKITEVKPKFVKFMPDKVEDGIHYISKEFKISTHNCPCGCGEKVVIPLGLPDGWEFIENDDKTITLNPSLANRFECKSHYYIRQNKIEWC